jgi:hypothetical protein
MLLRRGRNAVTSRAAGPRLDDLNESDEAMALEGEAEIGERGALEREREWCRLRAIDAVRDDRTATGEGDAERISNRQQERAVDHRHEGRIARGKLHRFDESRCNAR